MKYIYNMLFQISINNLYLSHTYDIYILIYIMYLIMGRISQNTDKII